jgi:2-isopropylmalate synthase
MSPKTAEPGATDAPPGDPPALTLARWTVTSGSNVQSRGAVVLTLGESQWEASAEGNGPIDALYNAVDVALAGVLDGHPRLLSYDIHALSEGTDAEAEVRVKVSPPEAAGGRRAIGRYIGVARSTNIVAASIKAYCSALEQLLAEAHWAGATEAAGNRKRARSADVAKARRAELDETVKDEPITWFER